MAIFKFFFKTWKIGVILLINFFFVYVEIYFKLQGCESLSPKKKTLWLKIGICYTSYIFLTHFPQPLKVWFISQKNKIGIFSSISSIVC